MRTSDNYGVVEFNVLTDMNAHIELVCKIATAEHSTATHYQIYKREDGSTVLHLHWMKSSSNIELPFPLNTAESIAQFISSWLQTKAEYAEDRYHWGDGSSYQGVRLTNRPTNPPTEYNLVIAAEPDWTYYGK